LPPVTAKSSCRADIAAVACAAKQTVHHPASVKVGTAERVVGKPVEKISQE
jgi:hypothetical protein